MALSTFIANKLLHNPFSPNESLNIIKFHAFIFWELLVKIFKIKRKDYLEQVKRRKQQQQKLNEFFNLA